MPAIVAVAENSVMKSLTFAYGRALGISWQEFFDSGQMRITLGLDRSDEHKKYGPYSGNKYADSSQIVSTTGPYT